MIEVSKSSTYSLSTMPRVIIVMFLLIAAAGELLAKARALDLPDSLDEAVIVAEVKIVSDTEVSPANIPPKRGEYQRVATARVVTPIKGCATGDVIKLAHSSDLMCPNIVYLPGQDSVVFLVPSAVTGAFDTMCQYSGRFEVRDGMISNFYLFPGFDWRERSPMPLMKVIEFLRQEVAKGS